MMKKNKLNKLFWEERYKSNDTGWDIGDVSTPIESYINQLENFDLKILIPGAGNSFEAEYLWKKGFKNTYILDIAEMPLNNFKRRVPEFPENQIIHSDFFNLNDTFDLIIEQTFFCALNPELREDYIKQMNKLLVKNGKLIGLLFDFELTEDGPPFGGSKSEYINRFSKFFSIKTLEPSYNSIKPRENRELFFIFEKTN